MSTWWEIKNRNKSVARKRQAFSFKEKKVENPRLSGNRTPKVKMLPRKDSMNMIMLNKHYQGSVVVTQAYQVIIAWVDVWCGQPLFFHWSVLVRNYELYFEYYFILCAR